MIVTPREQQVLDALRRHPLLDAAGIAERIGSSKAAVAVHLSSLTRKGAIIGRGYLLREEPAIVVVGGAAMDIKARSLATAGLRTSNPGTTRTSPGGVGRNIAENVARLGGRVHLVAPVGRDAMGEQLTDQARAAGILIDHLLPTQHPTGTYTAVLDESGELVIGIADMAATESLTPEQLGLAHGLIGGASLVVADGNLPVPPLQAVLDRCAEAEVPVVLDPVSVPKAARMRDLLDPGRPVLAITPNVDELAALTGVAVSGSRAIRDAAEVLHDNGVDHVWVRRGTRGSLLCSRGQEPQALAAPQVPALDVTGAGDAMTGAFVHAVVSGRDVPNAVRRGQVAAALTVQSEHTVRPDLTTALLDAALLEHGPAPETDTRTAQEAHR